MYNEGPVNIICVIKMESVYFINKTSMYSVYYRKIEKCPEPRRLQTKLDGECMKEDSRRDIAGRVKRGWREHGKIEEDSGDSDLRKLKN